MFAYRLALIMGVYGVVCFLIGFRFAQGYYHKEIEKMEE